MRNAVRFRHVGAALAAAVLVGSALAFPPAPAEDKSEKIVFTSVADEGKKLTVVLIKPDGSGRTTLSKGETGDADPALSPDGQRIAFIVVDRENKKADVWVMKADGTDRKRLTEEKAKSLAVAPAWSPDGKRIAYSILKEPGPGGPEGELFVMDADGKNAKGLGQGLWPAWSPDGKKLLCTGMEKGPQREPRLHVMDADGKNDKALLGTPSMLGAWSPDGKRIAFVGAPTLKADLPNIYLCNADGSGPEQLTKGKSDLELAPRWSPDGKRVYFSRMPAPKNEAPTKAAIMAIDADGKNEKELTKGDGMDLLGGAELILMTRATSSNKP